jgi:hypothetical protein
MNARVLAVIAALDAFAPSEVDTETTARLYAIFEGFRDVGDREAAILACFGVMERYPVVDLGTPGPLVHELEAIPGYQTPLRDSIRRQPSRLAIWMANRILNSDLEPRDREAWLAELVAVLSHTLASEVVRVDAEGFLAYQAKRFGQSG